MIKIRCSKHPRYQAVYPPGVICLACYYMYLTRLFIYQTDVKLQMERGNAWQPKRGK